MKKPGKTDILTGLSCVGVIGTAFLSGKATIKAYDFIKSDIPKKEKVKRVAPYYIPTALAGSATLASIIFTHRIDSATIGTLATALVAANEQLNSYREAVIEEVGEEKEADIRKKVVENKIKHVATGIDETIHLFYLPYADIWFESTTEEVLNGIYLVNRVLIDYGNPNYGVVTISDFLEYINHPELKTEKTDKAGWAIDILSMGYDTYWLDGWISRGDTEDGEACYEIFFGFDPEDDIQEAFDRYERENFF